MCLGIRRLKVHELMPKGNIRIEVFNSLLHLQINCFLVSRLVTFSSIQCVLCIIEISRILISIIAIMIREPLFELFGKQLLSSHDVCIVILSIVRQLNLVDTHPVSNGSGLFETDLHVGQRLAHLDELAIGSHLAGCERILLVAEVDILCGLALQVLVVPSVDESHHRELIDTGGEFTNGEVNLTHSLGR